MDHNLSGEGVLSLSWAMDAVHFNDLLSGDLRTSSTLHWPILGENRVVAPLACLLAIRLVGLLQT